jgi:oligoribonuclease NrnB/cAMP/cGMP phosphodiesterase (DHH superfamily)
MKKYKIFTDGDLDGVCCAIVSNIVFGDENVDYEICGYQNINEKISAYIENKEYEMFEKTYITDISVNKEVAEMINNKCKSKFRLLDHHKTADFLNTYEWATVIVQNKDNIKECGTSLLYQELYGKEAYNGNELGNFVEMVRQYDTWEWKNSKKEFPKQLNDIFGIIGAKDFIDYYSHNYEKSIEEFAIIFPNQFLELLKYKRREIDLAISEKLKKVKIIGKTTWLRNLLPEKFRSKYFLKGNYAITLCDRKDLTSELGSKILDKFPNINYVMLVYDGGIALRSVGDFDVSEIAKKYGGGGHKNAAGFITCKWYKFLE